MSEVSFSKNVMHFDYHKSPLTFILHPETSKLLVIA